MTPEFYTNIIGKINPSKNLQTCWDNYTSQCTLISFGFISGGALMYNHISKECQAPWVITGANTLQKRQVRFSDDFTFKPFRGYIWYCKVLNMPGHLPGCTRQYTTPTTHDSKISVSNNTTPEPWEFEGKIRTTNRSRRTESGVRQESSPLTRMLPIFLINDNDKNT